MKKMFKNFRDLQSERILPIFILLCAFFLCGAVLGSFTAAKIETDTQLFQYLNSYVADVNANSFTGRGLGLIFINSCKYHLISGFFAFWGIGLFVIPLMLLFKGFALSFSISALIKFYGINGIFSSFLSFGILNLISLPCLLLIAAPAFRLSSRLFFSRAGRREEVVRFLNSSFLLIFFLTLVILFLCSLYEYFCVPTIFSFLSNVLKTGV